MNAQQLMPTLKLSSFLSFLVSTNKVVDFCINRTRNSTEDLEGPNRYDSNYYIFLCSYYSARLILLFALLSFSKIQRKRIVNKLKTKN